MHRASRPPSSPAARGRHRPRALARGRDAGRPPRRAAAAVRGLDDGTAKAARSNRFGQCVLTSPGSACYAGLTPAKRSSSSAMRIRFFGDGWQISKRLGARRFWRVPVMDGEFVCEWTTFMTKGAVGGGNLLLMGATADTTLAADRGGGRAPCARCPTSSCRFPAASPARARKSARSTRAPAPRPTTPTARRSRARSTAPSVPRSARVLEIVIDGLTSDAVRDAMRAGLTGHRRARAGARARCASAPATTAASSAVTIITSESCCREAARLHAPVGPRTAARPHAADAREARRKDRLRNRRARVADDPRARDGRRRVPRPHGGSGDDRHRGRLRAVRPRRRGARERNARRGGERRGRSRPVDERRASDHTRRRRTFRGLRDEGRRARDHGLGRRAPRRTAGRGNHRA